MSTSVPPGVTQCIVTYGKALGPLFTEATRIEGTLTIDRKVIHTATGWAINKVAEKLPQSAFADGVLTFQVAHVDQDGFQDESGAGIKNWSYTLSVNCIYAGGTNYAQTKVFQVFEGDTNIDLDLRPSGASAPPAVTSSGWVTDAQAARDAAALSAADAADSEAAAGSSATAAGVARTDAQAARDAAALSAADAADSETAAAGSATAAAGSEATATEKAGEAASSATTATTKAGEAATSAGNAATDRAAAQTARTGAESARDGALIAAAVWTAGEAVTTATVRQAPDGSRIRSNADRTTGSSFDATEQTFWTPVLATAGTMEQASLSTAFVPLKAGPRSIPRVKQGLRPILTIDEQYPKPEAGYSHRILWGGGNGAGGDSGRWYSWGHDSTLRFSTDRGRTWSRMYNGSTSGQFGRDGLFCKVTTDDQILLTTYHPYDGSAPELKRSTDYGTTWTTVQGPTTDVKYLGPNSVCKSPVTGNLYLAEYVTATPAAHPTVRIMKSTDQGATWTAWKTLSRAYDTDPENGVMHFHGIQVDPFTNRLWVLVGDAAKSAGLYRMLADESDWEAICTNRMSGAMPATGATNNKWCGAVSVMFFPNYISWGVDQSYTGNLLRLARTEFGSAAPNVEVVAPLNSTAFFAARAELDHTVWVLSASQEGGSGGERLDNSVHLYRVADDAATVDELGSIPVHDDSAAFSWAFPIGGSLQDLRTDLMWWGTNISDGPAVGDVNMIGTQFAARLGWSNSLIVKPSSSKLYELPVTQTSPIFTAVGAGGYRDWGVTIAGSRATVLYIIEAGVKSWNGAGAIGQKAGTVPRVEIWRTSPFGLAKLDGGSVDASFGTSSRRTAVQGMSDAYVHKITGLAPNEEIQFRLVNTAAATAAADLSGYITYAWGY